MSYKYSKPSSTKEQIVYYNETGDTATSDARFPTQGLLNSEPDNPDNIQTFQNSDLAKKKYCKCSYVKCCLLLCFAIIIAIIIIIANIYKKKADDDCFFCNGPLLDCVQKLEIFNDSKTYVDLFMLKDPETVRTNFKKYNIVCNDNDTDIIKDHHRKTVKKFIAFYFDKDPNIQLEIDVIPSDYKDKLSVLPKRIKDLKYRQFALDIHRIWVNLSRRVNPIVVKYPKRTSLIIPKHHDLIFVPGGRFREIYYQDGYQILKGLLRSEMDDSALKYIENLDHFITEFGFIPNGARKYYKTRSQPPLFSKMVYLYQQHKNEDKNIIEKFYDNMVKEYKQQMKEENGRVVKLKHNNQTFLLNRYYANTSYPRPESYREDFEKAKSLSSKQQTKFYSDVVAAAESGQDFSSRQFSDPRRGLATINTLNIVPVELNAYLAEAESIISKFSRILGHEDEAKRFEKARKNRINAMHIFLYSSKHHQQFDYNLKGRKKVIRIDKQGQLVTSVSNFIPLQSKAYNEQNISVYKVVKAFKNSKLMNYRGGIPATLEPTRQQWDFPNAQSPLNCMMVDALRNIAIIESKQIAYNIAEKQVRNNYLAFKRTGKMFEKLDVTKNGSSGHGGEYKSQIGFGWTNGCILDLLYEYGSVLKSP